MRNKNNVIAFRVDASEKIGSGHLMRCLALAEELHNSTKEIQIILVCRELPSSQQDFIFSRGYSLKLLPNQPGCNSENELFHAGWLKVSQKQDAIDTLKALENFDVEWLVVDHYAIDCKWEEILRSRIKKIAVIDDLADRHHVCDLLVDQNFHANALNRYDHKVPETCKLLLGPKYALLRNEFLLASPCTERLFFSARRILICFGGVDYQNHTYATLQVVAAIGGSLEVDVVVGVQCPHIHLIQKLCIAYGYKLHIQTKNIASLMIGADLSIGSGGVSLWERCAMGLPSIVLATTHNQKEQVSSLAENGIIMAIPEIGVGIDGCLGVAMRNLINNNELRKSFSKHSLKLVDSLGASRVASHMNAMLISVRAANFEDSELVYGWRNHPDIRVHCRESDPIDYEVHAQWFKRACQSEHKLILIGELSDIPVGVIRLDIVENEAEVSIFMNPTLVSRGFGASILLHAEKFIKDNIPSISILNAEVLGNNIASHSLFINGGYAKKFTKYTKRI